MAKTATVQYRHLKTDELGEGANLKDLVVDVLRRRGEDGSAPAEQAKLRIVDLDQDGTFVILNKLSPTTTWDQPIFAGQLIHLHSTAEVQAVTQSLEDNTDEFQLENLDLGGETKVLKGALYFAMVENHVGLIEGQQVRGRTFERYLTRILQAAGELDAGQTITLNAKFAAGNGKSLDSATAMTIGTARGRSDEYVETLEERQAAQTTQRGNNVFDVLKMLGWDANAINSLKREIPDEGWVEGFFSVKMFGRGKRKRPIARATIEEALRNIDESDLGLSGEGTERNGIVKLSKPMSVRTVNNLLEPTSAMEAIIESLKHWAEAGKIDCTFD